MRSLLLSAAGAALCVTSLCLAQAAGPVSPPPTKPAAAPTTQPNAGPTTQTASQPAGAPPAAQLTAGPTTQPDSGTPAQLAGALTTQPANGPTTQAAAGTQRASTQPATQAWATTLPSPDSFIPRLSSDDWQKRQAAEVELVHMGEDARAIIQNLLSRPLPDAETRTRLEAALLQINENRILGASFITMHLKDANIKTVFAELSRQCYADLKPFPDNLFDQGDLAKVTIDVDHKPFWTAMTQIADKTGVDLQQYSDGIRLMRGGFRMNSAFNTVQGPFLVMATQISRSQTEMLANGGGSSSDFSLQMMAYSEPKLHVLSSSAIVKLDEAVDDAGNSLLPTTDVNRGYYGGAGGCWNLFAQLKYPEHPGKKIARLRGSAGFLVQIRSQRIEIPDIKNIKEQSRLIGDIPVIFHDLKKTGDNWELRISGNPQAMGNNRLQQFYQSIQTSLQLQDEKGQALDHRGMSSRGQNNNQVDYTVLFSASTHPGDGRGSTDPAKLVWEVTTASKEVRVQFDFKDLPMPH